MSKILAVLVLGVPVWVACTPSQTLQPPETIQPTIVPVTNNPIDSTLSEEPTVVEPAADVDLTPETFSPLPQQPPLPEPQAPVIALSLKQEKRQSNPSDLLPAVPLAGAETGAFLDIRGVGDAAMALTHAQPQPLTGSMRGFQSHFGQRLDAFDASGKSYRGDLSFINWESTIGTRCRKFWAPPVERVYAFMSHPDNLWELYQRGFNLIGLANNHTRDCPQAEEGVKGEVATARHMERIGQETGAEWLWHGVGTRKAAVVQTISAKGRPVRVAFASLYLNGGDCAHVTCRTDELVVLRSLRDAAADLRILSLHSWTPETQQKELVNMGVKFIQHFDGDIVFGHGHYHQWAPVRVVQSARGKRGVLFESLGNFIHPSLRPRANQMIGRVLFDLDTLKLRQVQAIPIAVNRLTVSFRGATNPQTLPANLAWSVTNAPQWQSEVSPHIKAVYANIQQ